MNRTVASATSVPAIHATVPMSVRSISNSRCSRTVVTQFGGNDPRRDELQHIDRLDLLLNALRADALLQHDQAVRAAARHLCRSGVRHLQLLDAPVVHALPHLL